MRVRTTLRTRCLCDTRKFSCTLAYASSVPLALVLVVPAFTFPVDPRGLPCSACTVAPSDINTCFADHTLPLQMVKRSADIHSLLISDYT